MQCLNCNNTVKEHFCPTCGQKTSTHRFSFSSIFDDGILNGIFNINKSFFYTLKALFTKPGHSIRDYIQGKRIHHFNAFSLFVLLIAIEYLTEGFFGNVKTSDIWTEMNESSANSFDQIITTYPQLTYLFILPIMTISSYLFFRRSQLNFAENIILNTYAMSAYIVLGLPFILLIAIINDTSYTKTIIDIYALICFIYGFWFFYQLFSAYQYKKLSLVLRVFLTLITALIFKFIALASIIGIKNIVE